MKSKSIEKRYLRGNRGRESIFQTRVRKYMEQVTTVLPRAEGNGWNLVKFHELLHIERNIITFGAPCNSDSSRCESFGKSFGKELARRTQQNANTMGIQSAQKYCNWIETRRMNILLGLQQQNSENEKEKKEGLCGSQFFFKKEQDSFSWKHNNSARWVSFDRDELNSIHAFLFKESANGYIDDEDIVYGFTEYKKDGIIFRAHPLFNGNRPWFDWCYVNWGQEIGNKIARICMFIDLSECNILYSEDKEFDHERVKLKSTKYCMIQSVSDIEFDGGIYHLRTRLGERIGLERHRRIVPLDSISAPAFVKTNDVGMIDGILPPFDNTIISYVPIDDWHKHFN